MTRKYDHKREFFSRRIKEEQNLISDVDNENDWIMILDADDLSDMGVYDKLAEVYGDSVADIFMDWVDSREYMKSNYKIWVTASNVENALISDGTAEKSASLFINDKITLKGGISGMSLSARYIKNNLVKVKSDLEHNDVLFCGADHLLGHVNPDSDVEFFQDPDGNVTVTADDF